MEQLLEFSKGPLFRLTFAIMVLGLARVLILDLLEIFRAYRRAGDKTVPWGQVITRSIEWLVPVRLVFKRRPVYSVFSMLFHVGLLLVPMQCRHCFHQFLLPWFLTWGKEITPTPRLRIAPATRPTRLSHAAEHYAAQQASQDVQTEDESSTAAEEPQAPVPSRPRPRRMPVRRADAA